MNSSEIVTLELLNGYKINAIKNDLITNEIIRHGIYEKPLFLFLKAVLAKGRLNCIDVGANIGVVSLTMCKYGNQVVSFEPIPKLFELLKASIKDNHIDNCTVYNVGLSNKNATAKFFVQTDGNIGSSSLSPKARNQNTEEVSVTLAVGDENESIQSLEKIDLLKVDVEGHEPEVILGLRKTIQRDQPIIIMEWDNDLTRNGFNEHKIFEKICSGYSVFYLCSRMSAFRRYSRKNKFIAPVRAPLRLMYQLFMGESYKEAPVLLSDFDSSQAYASLVLVPEGKLDLVRSFVLDA